MMEKNKGKPRLCYMMVLRMLMEILHIGTAMNRVLKDFVVKSKHMMGYDTPFYPGWDTHGLPIENMMPSLVMTERKCQLVILEKNVNSMPKSRLKFKWLQKRLGTVAQYDYPYITMDKSFEADQIRTFGKWPVRV